MSRAWGVDLDWPVGFRLLLDLYEFGLESLALPDPFPREEEAT